MCDFLLRIFRKKLYFFLSALLLQVEVNSQPVFNVKTPDGRIITSTEWVNSAENYGEKITRLVQPLIVYIENDFKATPCEVNVNLSDDGKIEKIVITNQSSDPKWCSAVTKAVQKSMYFPKSSDGKLPKTVSIKFSP
jgi:membrane protein involved in colicin uptake